MLKTFYLLIFITIELNAMSQNIGIGTTNPGSTLSVGGSISAGYNNITNNYILTSADYFVVYNGALPATVTLPAALAIGSGNFKGRVYKIKNNSPYLLTLSAAGSERINLDNALTISEGTTVELISTGLTSGSTWEGVSGVPPDGIRKALLAAGCSSCNAYDAANFNAWVEITSGEYATLLSNIIGILAYGATSATMAATATNGFGAGTTITQNFTTQTQLPPGNYPVALSFKTGTSAPASISNMNLKFSNTGQSAGYNTIPSANSLNAATSVAQTIYYFVLKRSSVISPPGAPSNMAIHQNSTSQLGAIVSSLSTYLYYGSGDISNPNNSINWTPLFQVLATPAKQW